MAEEIADSWEDLENCEALEKHLAKLVSTPVEPTSADNVKKPLESVTSDVVALPVVTPKVQEEMIGRTAYQPTVRILKRETNNTQNSCSQAERLAAKPIRTLEEREAAYAEARLRILGSACSPEDNNEDEKNSVVSSENGLSGIKKVPSTTKLTGSSTSISENNTNSSDVR